MHKRQVSAEEKVKNSLKDGKRIFTVNPVGTQ